MMDDFTNPKKPLDYEPVAPAANAEQVHAYHQANRIAWNQGASAYRQEIDETIAFLRQGGSNLHPIERAHLGNLRDWCNTAVHLQCASGKDTLSLWNEGVTQVVGVDIAEVHIENARRTGESLQAPARWYCCDVLQTPHELDGCADLVYTGRGAICWLHDLTAWAQVIYRLLKPGGRMHILDDHPVSWLFDQDSPGLQASGVSYFNYAEIAHGWPETYLGDLGLAPEQHADKYERLWPVSAIIQALHDAGLIIDIFGEHAQGYWDSFPKLSPSDQGKIPLTFSILAHRPL
jgi:SAM-dependent methyltransferase